MPARPVGRGRQPWNKGLLVGQKKPLEPKHVWSIRVRLEIARSKRDLAIFNLAIDSKLRGCDLVKLRLEDICSGTMRGVERLLSKRRLDDRFSLRSQSSRGIPLRPGYQCSGLQVRDISSPADFMQVLIFQPANMPGWCIAGFKASA
jgi:hypothetical protein